MAFRPDEWESLALLIEEGWPGEFTDAQAAAWRVFLDDYSTEQVFVAIKALVAKGGAFRPSVAEVVAEIRSDPSKPTFEEAYRLIYGSGGALRARPRQRTFADLGEQGRAHRAAILERAQTLHPLVASFIERYGVDRLISLEVDHPDFGDLKRKELREAWERHCEAMEGREVAAIASGRRDGLHAFDPLAALKGPDRPQIGAGS